MRVSIATPHHWHAIMAIWAMQAGKDVYIEKPCSHNLWEGKQLVRAVSNYNRIVQHGTQSRSLPSMIDAMRKMQQDAVLGDVYLSRGLCFKWRDTIGHTPVSPVPAGVDYNLWTGPAPLLPFTKNHFHYNWHWFWDYGNGDLGNQGIHQLDIARWGLGPGLGFPNEISAVGGHVMFDDDQQTPNVLNCSFKYDRPNGKPIILRIRSSPLDQQPRGGYWSRPQATSLARRKSRGGLGASRGKLQLHRKYLLWFKGIPGHRQRHRLQNPFWDKARSRVPSSPLGEDDHFRKLHQLRDQQEKGRPESSNRGRTSFGRLGTSGERLLPAGPHIAFRSRDANGKGGRRKPIIFSATAIVATGRRLWCRRISKR